MGEFRLTTVLHAAWIGGGLHLWAESADALGSLSSIVTSPAAAPTSNPSAADGVPTRHPFASDPIDAAASVSTDVASMLREFPQSACDLKLPFRDGTPVPSTRLAFAFGHSTERLDRPGGWGVFRAPSVIVPASLASEVLSSLTDSADDAAAQRLGGSVLFFAEAARFVRFLLAQQRFVPALSQSVTGELSGAWTLWMSDEANAERASQLLAGMPASARAGVDALNHEAWPVLESFLNSLADAACRRTLIEQDFFDSVKERDATTDPHVAWLKGLLSESVSVPAFHGARQELPRRVRAWLGLLEDRGPGSSWRLCLRLNEPRDPGAGPISGAIGNTGEDLLWELSFHLQAVDRPTLILDASDIWILPGDAVTVQGKRVEGPQEILLAELGRASRLYKRLEEALGEVSPTNMSLTTRQAYEFLREVRPILLEQGFAVQAPDWWESPVARLGARLRIEGDGPDPTAPPPVTQSSAAAAHLGMGALVKYRWEIAVGDTTLTLHEFEQLASKRSPLVRVNGRWVEIRPEDVQNAIKFIHENPGGSMRIGEAMRLAYGSDLRQTGIPVLGMEASGWFAAFLGAESLSQQMRVIDPPSTFQGTLRPYQIRGVSWMAFLEKLGFGICLADDMGLGKTIQLLALMAHERECGLTNGNAPPAVPATEGSTQRVPLQPAPAVMHDPSRAVAPPNSLSTSSPVGPTLLLVPMSVVGNWIHETRRFCPHLRVMVHHGADRLTDESLVARAKQSDLVISTYALAHRDKEALSQVPWWRIVLDEAQYIKNPAAKQSQAVRKLNADRRVALTGTPVENRLAELWSIMDFLNPGYLGGSAGFRQRFGVAIERYHDRARAEQLRGLIRPFVLRRLKTDPNVVSDLPDKVESREYCHLTSEQASLYETCVRRMLAEVEEAEGIQRRGLVLSALIRLKQICNHPSLILKDAKDDDSEPGELLKSPPEASRSGKCIRIMEMLDEVIAEGDKALVFTQFRQMGHLLVSMMRHHLGRDILFLHGGTTQGQRQQIIDTFQKDGGSAPILVLSLKAGGVGLNLTAATHVFHFDRWWNPAVENQATDRAYRIGQTRTVQVHKFVVRGTLEERIDQMIESKTALAENIIGAGENWLTEMGTEQLREILTLRNDAVSDEI